MKVMIAGGTGFIGEALVWNLLTHNHRVIVLSRSPKKVKFQHACLSVQYWDGVTAGEWARTLEGCDGVVNLAGESIAGGRWTAKRKEHILSSRINATRTIVGAIGRAQLKPKVLVSASAVGYYGHVEAGDVFEDHLSGSDFLSDVCQRWEQEAHGAEKFGVRVVLPRLGVVLARRGGALSKLAMPFRLFAGGWLGSGGQFFTWIHRDDVVGTIVYALKNGSVIGPLNLAAPEPMTMKEFCRVLGRVLHRPCWAPVPAVVLRVALGDMAAMLLTGQRAIPKKLQEFKYVFRFPTAREALRSIYQ